MEVRYINCIKLSFKRAPVLLVSRLDILKAFKSFFRMDVEAYQSIKRVGQMGNNLTWYVEFRDEAFYKKVIGLKIAIKEQELVMEDADDPFVTKQFRVLHLWANAPNEFLLSNFSKYGQVVKLFEEVCEDEELGRVLTGVMKVVVKFNKEQQKKINEIHGVKYFKDHRFIVQMVGMTSCFICGSQHHKKANCTNKDKKCTKCKRRGHVIEECNDALKLFKNNFNEALLDMDDDDDEAQVQSQQANAEQVVQAKQHKHVEGTKERLNLVRSHGLGVKEKPPLDDNQHVHREDDKQVNPAMVENNVNVNDEHLLAQQISEKFVASTPCNVNNQVSKKRAQEDLSTKEEEKNDEKKGRQECSYLGDVSTSTCDEMEEDSDQ